MTFFSRASFSISLVATLAFLGAGCTRTDTNSPIVTPSATTTNSNLSSGGDGTAASPTILSTSTTLDTTGWQTYQNKTLKFSFQSPNKGSFAPAYEVKLFSLKSKEFPHDCAKDNGLPTSKEQHLLVNGTPFCRTITSEGAAGSTYNQETWVTKTDTWYAVITFTKKYVTDPRIIGGCEDGGKNAGKPQCLPFDLTNYQRQIENVMSTFSLPKKT